jgi:3-oxoacyl-[acyl-carrier protein] reductase
VRRLATRAQSRDLGIHHDSSICTDRVAVVTGGSRGVGREIVRELASRDYALVVGYIRNQAAAESVVEEVLAANGNALAIRADVADELDVERLFTETAESFGPVDVVVHAAGRSAPALVTGCDLETFDAVQRTNVRGTFVVNRQAARRLRDGGAIVNLSGAAGGLALPTDAASAASMGAVEAMTRALARDLRGRHVTVNAVVPGLVGQDAAAAVAHVVALLVGDDGRGLNGQVIRIDGWAE